MFVLATGPVAATTIRVPGDYATINAGLDAAALGDTVLVAPGTYDHGEVRQYSFGHFPVETASVAFLQDGVTLRSEQGPGLTILDLVEPSASNESVIVGAVFASDQTRVEGFTIRSTAGVEHGMVLRAIPKIVVEDCVFEGIVSTSGGAAIDARSVGLEVRDCTFEACEADGGAAVWSQSQNLLVAGCRVESCGFKPVFVAGDLIPDDHVRVEDSVFHNNYSDTQAGAVSIGSVSTSEIEGCWFENNLAMAGSGGAIAVAETNITLHRNVFVGNRAGTAGRGGAFAAINATGVVTQNTFYGNAQDIPVLDGSTIRFDGVVFALERNVIAGGIGGAAVWLGVGNLTTSCNVFWDNEGGEAEGFVLDPSDRIVDPEFCDVEEKDFTVTGTSPCLPQNSMGCGQIGSLGQGCGVISVEPNSWAKIKMRYSGDR
jgi:hypothetical protein